MKILCFDCFSGVSGSMILNALINLDNMYLKVFLDKMHKLLPDNINICINERTSNSLKTKELSVNINDESIFLSIEKINNLLENTYADRYIKDLVLKIIDKIIAVKKNPLSEDEKNKFISVFNFINILGTAVCLSIIGAEKIFVSPIKIGKGFSSHGNEKEMACSEEIFRIFSKTDIMVSFLNSDEILADLCGAAIISEIAEFIKEFPEFKIISTGLGLSFGKNCLRVFLCEAFEENDDFVWILETNIDDSTGEIMGYTLESLFELGVKDAFYTPIFMKKNRPAQKLTVLCEKDKIKEIEDLIFRETTTIGIRKRKETRSVLQREFRKIKTIYGELDVKVAKIKETEKVYPEYESAKILARKNKVTLKEVYNEIYRNF